MPRLEGGFNVHTIVLSIPIEELGLSDQQTVGVWATTSRRRVTALRTTNTPQLVGAYIQVGRQGNPLFCEAFIPIADKDRYNRQTPARDAIDFAKYALAPELAKVLLPNNPEKQTNRTDLAGIFIPDLIKVDLSTPQVRLAGGSNAGAAPYDPGFSRLSAFGCDTLFSTQANAQVAGGWPNGRRFGDDVLRELGIGIGVEAVAPLLSFNLGVEMGQLAVAALVFPAILRLRAVPVFTNRAVPACSIVIAAAGAYWFIERTFGAV